MTRKRARAYPRKHFFLEMFTRDLSLEDCILDLIDNSIDGLVRTCAIDISTTLLSNGSSRKKPITSNRLIEINFSEESFEIKDNCGGIPRKLALSDVFNFGHGPDASPGVLSVYGVGLKRALFKLGNRFQMQSCTAEDGFTVDLDVKKWAKDDDSLDDWTIPLTYASAATSAKPAGTRIFVSPLRDEVRMMLRNGSFEQRLRMLISRTYCLFIKKYVRIKVNKIEVEPMPIPIAESSDAKVGHDVFELTGVRVELFAGLAERKGGEWKADLAGWYVLCNGRIVVAADHGELTGWGVSGFPLFHDGKFRGFVGIAYFTSDNADSLPWTTTKRGLNRESAVYQMARNRMRGIARPIITFLDQMYKRTELPEERHERIIAENVKAVSLSQLSKQPSAAFAVSAAKRPKAATVRVQYDADVTDVERIKKHLKKSSWGASKVGKYVFDQFVKTECPE